MLIGTLTTLLIAAIVGASGGAGAGGLVPNVEVAEMIDDLIEDEDRRERVKGVAEDADALREATNESYSRAAESFTEMGSDRDRGQADFEAIVDGLELDAGYSQILDLRYRLQHELTEEEWNTLYGDLVVPE